MIRRRIVGALAAAAAVAAVPAEAQIPTEFRNLRVLPADITRDSLVAIMRRFTFATGLRCDDCHVMGEDGSFQGARFDLDEKPAKRKARYMIEMVGRINGELLAGLPDRSEPRVAVECKTCHRGLSKPWLLRTELRHVLETEGIDATVARYRELHETQATSGAYDFTEWEINELAREVAAAGRTADAIALLVLNAEFHPESPSIPAALAPLYEELGQKDNAIAAWRRVLEIVPDHRGAQVRLRALTGGS